MALDYGPWFHGMGENLRLCFINHVGQDKLLLQFESRIRNAWFQTDGEGLVEVWFHREHIGDATKAASWKLKAKPNIPEPGMGIGTTPGFVAARVTGRLLTIEDVVYDYPPDSAKVVEP